MKVQMDSTEMDGSGPVGVRGRAYKQQLGRRIAEARTRAGMKQQELADHIGKSLRTIGLYEQGVTQPPGDVMNEIASVTQCSVAWLWDGDKTSEDNAESRHLLKLIVMAHEELLVNNRRILDELRLLRSDIADLPSQPSVYRQDHDIPT